MITYILDEWSVFTFVIKYLTCMIIPSIFVSLAYIIINQIPLSMDKRFDFIKAYM